MTSNSTTRVYLARLAGAQAFDPYGDQVGKIRDVVVTPRIARSPRLVGLVIEVSNRRRIFLPIGRVTSFEAGAIVVTGVINMRRFEPRPGEHLVMAELLDRTVAVHGDDRIPSGESVHSWSTSVSPRTARWIGRLIASMCDDRAGPCAGGGILSSCAGNRCAGC